MLKSMHLFAGAGGGLLADLILGHMPIIAVEHNPYRCAILRKRYEWWPGLRVCEGDVRLFDPSEYAGCVDIIHAGFPCQDISVAGRGAGIDGDRSGLYSEVIRIASVVRPRYLFLENSPAITTRGLYRVVSDLIGLGYVGRHGVVAAADVGAPHRRERWWCLAKRSDTDSLREPQPEGSEQDKWGWIGDVGKEISNAYSKRLQERFMQQGIQRKKGCDDDGKNIAMGDWWSIESNLGRVANGMANRIHRIEALGDGQVPLQAALAWKILGGP